MDKCYLNLMYDHTAGCFREGRFQTNSLIVYLKQ